MFLARNWWVFLLRGILALLFGIAAIFFPASAFFSLVLIFGAFAFIDGIFALISAFTSSAKSENWWWLIFEGLLGIAVGLLTIIQPGSMVEAMIYVIAAWAVVTGLFEVITAVRIRKMIEGEFWMILSGVISIIFGILIAADPLSGMVTIGILIAIYSILFALTLIALSLKLRSHRARHLAV